MRWAGIAEGSQVPERLKNWVLEQMRDRRLSQTELAEIMGISQSAISTRLLDGSKSRPFKVEEIEALERFIGKPSPLRYAPAETSRIKSIDPRVLKAVIRHLATEYPKIIKADADSLAESIVDLCEYVQQSAHGDLSPAESRLAMRRVLVESD